MTEALQYRLATPGDAPGVAALHAENWRRIYRGNFTDEYLDGEIFAERRSAWTSRLANPAANQYVCIAVQHGQVLGFICVFGAEDPEWGSFIDNLHIDASAQRRGIGSALMRHAGRWLASTFPMERVHLFVWELNPAEAVYARWGGRNCGVVELDNPGGGTGRYLRYVWDRPEQLCNR